MRLVTMITGAPLGRSTAKPHPRKEAAVEDGFTVSIGFLKAHEELVDLFYGLARLANEVLAQSDGARWRWGANREILCLSIA